MAAEPHPDHTLPDEIVELHRQVNEAIAARDRAALERCYDERFLFIHGLNYVDTRDDLIDELLDSDGMALPAFDFDEVFVTADVVIARLRTPTPAGNQMMSTSVYRRAGGEWRILQVQSSQLQFEREYVELDAQRLAAVAGTYADDAGEWTLAAEDGRLWARTGGFPRRWLRATSPNEFVDKAGHVYSFDSEHLAMTLRSGVRRELTRRPD